MGNLKAPSFVEEEMLLAQGYQRIAGVDEVHPFVSFCLTVSTQ